MWKTSDKNLFAIVGIYAVIQIAYLITEYQITGHRFGVPLDDVWIHFRFAENFTHGFFYQYNPGEPTPGTTSPFWVIFLSIPFLISQSAILPFALAASSVFFLLALVQLYKLCIKLGFDKNYSLITTLLTMLCGRLLWSSLSGMEITLFCLLCVTVVKNHLSEIENQKLIIVNGLLLGLAAATRPETYLLALIYFPLSLLLIRKNLKANIGRFIISLILFAALLIPYPIFSYIHTGNFLPNTYEGQVGVMKYIPNITFLIETGKMFVKDNFLILILWITGIGYFLRQIFKKNIDKKFLLINLWVILLPAVSSVVAPNWRHHGRYLIPLIPFINITAINILQKIYAYLNAKNAEKYYWFTRATLVIVFIVSLNSAIAFAAVLGWNSENINDQQYDIGTWLKKNLPDEKAFGLNDIGAITFVTKKYVVDMSGLVTPEVFNFQKMSYEDGSKNMFRLLKSKGINYIIIYPHWFDYLMDNYSKYFEQVYSAKLENNTICGGIEMFVYKIKWDKLNLN